MGDGLFDPFRGSVDDEGKGDCPSRHTTNNGGEVRVCASKPGWFSQN